VESTPVGRDEVFGRVGVDGRRVPGLDGVGDDEEREGFRGAVDGRHGRRHGIVYVDTNTVDQGRTGGGRKATRDTEG
jgi:hypothetical protein